MNVIQIPLLSGRTFTCMQIPLCLEFFQTNAFLSLWIASFQAVSKAFAYIISCLCIWFSVWSTMGVGGCGVGGEGFHEKQALRCGITIMWIREGVGLWWQLGVGVNCLYLEIKIWCWYLIKLRCEVGICGNWAYTVLCKAYNL